jgi:hypothetical protein
VLEGASISFLIVNVAQLDRTNVPVQRAARIPDLLEDLLVLRRLVQALDANAEQVISCGRATGHRAVRSAAAALEDDDEWAETHLSRLVRFRGNDRCVNCVLPSSFVWLVFWW